MITAHLKQIIEKQYYYFFSWGYFFSAGYFGWKKLNRLFLSESLVICC
ncbi:hypothetical protein Ga0466249_004113 [Sporomusaceae bacterium BoRhaA]|nr:hypothetical protein [Pelorhabdus rhamnosifermentans]